MGNKRMPSRKSGGGGLVVFFNWWFSVAAAKTWPVWLNLFLSHRWVLPMGGSASNGGESHLETAHRHEIALWQLLEKTEDIIGNIAEVINDVRCLFRELREAFIDMHADASRKIARVERSGVLTKLDTRS